MLGAKGSKNPRLDDADDADEFVTPYNEYTSTRNCATGDHAMHSYYTKSDELLNQIEHSSEKLIFPRVGNDVVFDGTSPFSFRLSFNTA